MTTETAIPTDPKPSAADLPNLLAEKLLALAAMELPPGENGIRPEIDVSLPSGEYMRLSGYVRCGVLPVVRRLTARSIILEETVNANYIALDAQTASRFTGLAGGIETDLAEIVDRCHRAVSAFAEALIQEEQCDEQDPFRHRYFNCEPAELDKNVPAAIRPGVRLVMEITGVVEMLSDKFPSMVVEPARALEQDLQTARRKLRERAALPKTHPNHIDSPERWAMRIGPGTKGGDADLFRLQ